MMGYLIMNAAPYPILAAEEDANQFEIYGHFGYHPQENGCFS